MNEIPQHAKCEIYDALPPEYFWPPSTERHPILEVEAFWENHSFFFKRSAVGEAWTRVK